MKHVQHTIIVVVLLSALLAACASPTQETEPTTIAFACMDYERDRYAELIQAFRKEHPSITVNLVSVEEVTGHGPGVASTEDVLKIASAADAFGGHASTLQRGSPQGVVLDLTDLAEQDERFDQDDFYPAALTGLRKNGKLWGLPSKVDMLVLFYNPKLFDAAGVAYPQIGWSWDDFVQAAHHLTIRQDGQVSQYGYVDPWSFYTLVTFAHQKAGPLVDSDQDPPVARLDVPGLADALQWYASLIQAHDVMPDPFELDDIARQRFVYEHAPAMWAGFTYEMDNFYRLYEAGLASFPEAGETDYVVQAGGYFVSAGTANPQAAWRWIEFLSRQPPASYEDSIPARRSTAEASHTWQELGIEASAVCQYALEHAVQYPITIHGALHRAFEGILDGKPVELVLSEAQTEANRWLAEEAAEARRLPTPISVATPAPTPTSGGTQVRFSLYYDMELSTYRALADQFQKARPDIAVEVLPRQGQTMEERAAAADCFVHHAGSLHAGDTDALLSLDPMVAEDEFELGAFSAFLEDVRADGKLWALPLETDASLLYYNRDLFDRAGVPCPSEPWTPQDWIARAIELTDTGAADPIYGFYPRDGAYANAPTWIARLGGHLFDANGQPTFDHPSVIAALTAYADLILQASPPAARERGDARWPAYGTWWGAHPGTSGSGNIATWVDLRGNHLIAPPLDFPVGVVPLPGGDVTTDASTLRALFISAKTPHPKACWAWIAFLSEQGQAVSLFPADQNIARSDAWREQVGADTADAWLSLLEREKTAQLPWIGNWKLRFSLYWFDAALAEVLDGAPPIAALAEAQLKASTFVDCVSASEDEAAWQACARQADPDVVLPEE